MSSRRRVPALTHDPSPLFQPPEVIGPYRVRRALASGTLGPRLLVEDDRGRLQVLKLITEATDDGDALARVLEHVRKSLPAHPGLLPVTEIGATPEGVYLASPVVDAPSVDGRLRGGRQSLDATLVWLRGIVGGLQAAHEAGVWHGAIHPRDVLVGDEGGVLTGVGVAPALEHLALQAPVRVPYTAPERASGQRWDARADQYSLAMLALDALSGRRLIAGTIPAFDRWTLAETPAEDARLHDVFVRALDPDPAQRFASLEEWLDALAGTQEAGQEGALSRFAREGVILATPAVATETPGRDIELQPLEDPEGVALSLFPEEDGTPESPLAAVAAPPTPSRAAEAEAEQEWLVADVPQDEVPTDAYALPAAPRPEPDDGLPVAPPTAPGWRFDDQDVSDEPAAPQSWEGSPDASPRRGPWLLVAVGLVLVALAYGTWRSLERADQPSPQVTTAPAAVDDEGGRGTTDSARQSTEASAARPVPQGPVQPSPAPAPTRERRTADALAPVAGPAGPAVESTPGPAEAAPVSGTGRVLIRSSPAGEVRVNGRPHGETPVVLRDLPFGSYVIAVSRPGFAPVERTVDLLPSQPVASVTVDLARQGAAITQAPAQSTPGRQAPVPAAGAVPSNAGGEPSGQPAPAARGGSIFVVSTPAQARLYVDGQLYGSTPASVPGLSPGSHTVRIEAAGHRAWQGQVEVMPGMRTRVQATLQQEQE